MTIQLNNPTITFQSTSSSAAPTRDFTGYIASATLTGQKPVISRNTFGTTGQVRNKKGRFDGSLTIDFDQDYASSALPSQYFFARMLEDFPIIVVMKSEQAAAGVANPKWTFQIAIDNMNLVDGDADSLATASLTWPIHGEIVESYA